MYTVHCTVLLADEWCIWQHVWCTISEVTSKLGVSLQIHACIAITNGSVCVSAEESWRRGRILLLHCISGAFLSEHKNFTKTICPLSSLTQYFEVWSKLVFMIWLRSSLWYLNFLGVDNRYVWRIELCLLFFCAFTYIFFAHSTIPGTYGTFATAF